MDLSTSYLGLTLPHPFVVGASYLDNPDRVRQAEEAGAAAVVLPSLFEEQVNAERQALLRQLEANTNAHGEAASYFPPLEAMPLGAEPMLDFIRRVKQTVRIPVIASLNATSHGGWLDYARQMEQTGVDALELNIYAVAADLELEGAAVEQRVLDIASHVVRAVQIPVAVKLSPYYSALANLAQQLDGAGVRGLVLFNRFFQPDIDLENLDVVPTLRLSQSNELPLRLAWLGLLSGRIRASLAVSGGVHTAEDAVKAVLCGADAIQVVSSLISNGLGHLATLQDGLTGWLKHKDYASLAQARGSMNLLHCPDPAAYQRANYMKMIKGWRP